MDPYAVLGVRPGASKEQIKNRYRELARQWHPDRNKDPGAGAKMQQINKAYEQLMNGGVRSASDADGKTPYEKWYRDRHTQKTQSADPFGFASQKQWDDIMNQGAFSQQWAEDIKKQFEKYQYRGSYTKPMKKCPHCNGTGEIPA